VEPDVFTKNLFLSAAEVSNVMEDSILEDFVILSSESAVEEESVLSVINEVVNEDVHTRIRGARDDVSRLENPGQKNMLRCFSTNADCLTNKLDEAKVLLADEKPDIMIITEVSAKNKTQVTPVVSMMCQGYDLFTNNLEKRGILMYVKTSLKANVEDLNTGQVDEALWCSIKLQGRDKLLVGAIYRSPNSPQENNDAMMRHLKTSVERREFTHFVITGDFNLKSVDWETWSTVANDYVGQEFLECFGDCGLFQKVTCFTRFRENQMPSTLDLILTNEEDMVPEVHTRPPLGKSDHLVLDFSICCYYEESNVTNRTYQYEKGNYEAMEKNLAETNWNEEFKDMTVEEMWTNVRDRLGGLVKKYVPCRDVRPDQVRKPVWMNYRALRAVKKKKNSWMKYQRTNNQVDLEEYKKIRNEATREVKHARKGFEKRLSENLTEDTKSFWAYTNSGMKVRAPVGDLEKQDGTMTENDQDKAEVLNDFFKSVFTVEDTTDIPRLAERHGGSLITELVITEEMVLEKLKSLKTNKSPGPDMCHPYVLSKLRDEMKKPLCLLFNKSLESGEIPDEWKTANISAIHKKHSKRKPSNYRPVSLTSVPCKIMESILRGKIMEHMDTQSLFAPQQHGFRPGRSCVTQLLEVMEQWTDTLDSGGAIDAIYFDFAKAFDTVPKERLIGKCESYGISGQILRWIRTFLTGRKQRVKVSGCFSEWTEVTSGIPQGSVLGPILFLLYINDLPDDLECDMKIFADDTKVYMKVETREDVVKMQEDVDSLCEWSAKWQLRFNAEKCSHMTYGRAKVDSSYTMKGTVGEQVRIKSDAEVEKDLGVTFDRKLTFRQHIGSIVKKINQLIALVRRTFKYIDCHLFRLLYTALMRPHFDYADCVWCPHYQVDVMQLENAQRRATRLVPELLDMTYEERLRKLNLPSLVYRRKRMDMIQTFRILNGIDRIDEDQFFTRSERQSRGHQFKLVKPRCRLNLRKHTFSNRIVDDWNALPAEVVEADDVTRFKVALDVAWASTRFSVNV